MQRTKSEQTMDWLEIIDRIGPAAPVATLRCMLRHCPPSAADTPEYHYILGLIVGRMEAATHDCPLQYLQQLQQAQDVDEKKVGWTSVAYHLRQGMIDGLELGLNLI